MKTQDMRQHFEDLSEELLRYGDIRYDLSHEDTHGNHWRLRVFKYKDSLFVHRMLNGELIELIEI